MLYGSSGGNAGSSDNALSLAGSDNNLVAKDNGVVVGTGAKLNAGIDLGSNTGQVTIGETGLGSLFSQTVKDINAQNSTALASVLSGTAQANLPNASTDLQNLPTEAAAEEKKKNWLLYAGLALSALSLLMFLFKRK